jgi:Spy/CpxP family protein refolding chaperone
MTPKLRAGLLLAGMFVLGGVAGASVHRFMFARRMHAMMQLPPEEARVQMRVRAMRRHLDLSHDQAQKIEAILRDAEKEHDTAEGPCRANLDAMHDRIHKRVSEVLTPEQREKADKVMARWGRRPPAQPP